MKQNYWIVGYWFKDFSEAENEQRLLNMLKYDYWDGYRDSHGNLIEEIAEEKIRPGDCMALKKGIGGNRIKIFSYGFVESVDPKKKVSLKWLQLPTSKEINVPESYFTTILKVENEEWRKKAFCL